MIQHFTVIFPLQVFLRNTICILYGTYSELSLLVPFSRLIRLKKKGNYRSKDKLVLYSIFQKGKF